ncbi:unnamed protein product [Medioppia subpectinata]|uniref:C2H2-type domain-containing protein n=1 Tax=Medioppia subpectinata TaxID=1979941 RepID=A0A7R9Q7U1_9ACAR|nr:unnamed protein product [Medioppia subpectinata]CAG2116105.1 unnamed protein product [Medioppia subpectinata]
MATAMDNNSDTHRHVESLYLKTDPTARPTVAIDGADQRKTIECLICPKLVAIGPTDESLSYSLQTHLLTDHKFMIADIDTIADLAKYCDHWRPKFAPTVDGHDWTRFCVAINTNSGPKDVAERETYYMIGGSAQEFPEDTRVREGLRQSMLDLILLQSQSERNDTEFSRQCIFCRKVFTENRANLFAHLAADHGLNVGNPDNIVHCRELLDVIDRRVTALQCLYCERTFKSWATMKEHMRKKGHRQLNPDNRDYDKFYLINYLSPERDWRDVKREVDVDVKPDGADDGCDADEESEQNEWNDWSESDPKDHHCICLFCEFAADIEPLKAHMKTVHDYDIDTVLIDRLEDFYNRIKVINYMRRTIHECRCHYCGQRATTRDSLLVHLEFSGHSKLLPDECDYDSPDNYFPTYENDNLLHFLDNTADEDNSAAVEATDG